MKKNDRMYAKTALRKNQISKHRSLGSSRFVPEGETSPGLKRAMVILPLLIITVLIVIVVAALTQFNRIVHNADTSVSAESSSQQPAAADDSKLLLVISSESPLPSDYKTDLVDYENIQVDRCIKPSLEGLMQAASDAGFSLKLVCGYVSAEIQHKNFQAEVDRLQREESMTRTNAVMQAEQTVPAENHSELQSGLAVLFSDSASFADTKEYHWLAANSMKYGFILRYPENKKKYTGFEFDPTHFRYVGKENAKKMTTLNMTLEEYRAYLDSRE